MRLLLAALLLSPAQPSRLFAPCPVTPWALPTHVNTHLV
jgi:hypothetical protein